MNNTNLQEALVLHDKIFGYHKKYSNPDLWEENLKNGKVYLFIDIGFMFVIRKEKSIHIWLCGILPKYRGHGYFRKFLDLLKKDPDFSEKFITISTFPIKFPDMYNILVKKGFTIISRDLLTDSGDKVNFRIEKSKL